MKHFAYTENIDKESLKQGDIIAKTEEIRGLLSDVHKHYLDDKYLYFIVLTQSCDLVLRDGIKCKTSYITLAAVRSLDEVIQREISKYQATLLERKVNIVNSSSKNKVSDFVRRLLNNNESEYFYLHEDLQIGFPKSVAFLKLSVAIKSDMHYKKCLDAKVLELGDNFKSKLGWLVGNMYSRVGTEDWTPSNMTEQAFNKWVNEILTENHVWIEDKKIIEFKGTLTEAEIEELESEEILKRLSKIKVKTRKDLLIELLPKIIKQTGDVEDNKINSLVLKINNNSEITAVLK